MPQGKFVRKLRVRKGALSKQLGIPKEKTIPMILLNKIVNAKAGDTIRNPSKKGKRIIKVTPLLERRAIFVRTLKNFPRRTKRR